MMQYWNEMKTNLSCDCSLYRQVFRNLLAAYAWIVLLTVIGLTAIAAGWPGVGTLFCIAGGICLLLIAIGSWYAMFRILVGSNKG